MKLPCVEKLFDVQVCICMRGKDPRYCRLALRHFWYQSWNALLKIYLANYYALLYKYSK